MFGRLGKCFPSRARSILPVDFTKLAKLSSSMILRRTDGSRSRYSRTLILDQSKIFALLLATICATATSSLAEGSPQKSEPAIHSVAFDPTKPVYRRSEIKKHSTKDAGIWITYGNGVYDITKFIVNHPGGQEKILLASGGAVEPFWKIYQQHYNSKLAPNALMPLLIGYLHPDDFAAETAEQEINSDDPYSTDPAVSPIQIFHQKKPINSESPSTLLSDTWVTPKEIWFNRNHHPVPQINAEDYRLSISGPGVKGNKVELTLEDLKTKFKKHKVSSHLQYRSSVFERFSRWHNHLLDLIIFILNVFLLF
jgi:cytochrome b involved in lipid metabolism